MASRLFALLRLFRPTADLPPEEKEPVSRHIASGVPKSETSSRIIVTATDPLPKIRAVLDCYKLQKGNICAISLAADLPGPVGRH
jgi:hypothetical protein